MHQNEYASSRLAYPTGADAFYQAFQGLPDLVRFELLEGKIGKRKDHHQLGKSPNDDSKEDCRTRG